jgi:hypothetical protein
MTGYDTASLDETRKLLLGLARGLKAFDHSFGAKSDVNPVRHLIATAAGWGGLPDRDASYIGVEPKLPMGEYELTVRDVPVDGWNYLVPLYRPRAEILDGSWTFPSIEKI